MIQKLKGIILYIVIFTISLTVVGVKIEDALSFVNGTLQILFQNISDIIIYLIG